MSINTVSTFLLMLSWGRASPPPDPLPRALRAKMNIRCFPGEGKPFPDPSQERFAQK